MYSAILNQHWLFNQDSFEWNIFFIADAVSLTVFSRAGAHKHSPEFPIPEMQILAFFLQLNANFCQVSSQKLRQSTITNEQIWQGMIKETDKDMSKGKKEFC